MLNANARQQAGVIRRPDRKAVGDLATEAPAVIDRQWVLAHLLDRGVDHLGLEPAGMIGSLDACQVCGDPLSWCPEWVYRCPEWVYRWPRLSDSRESV